VKQQDDPQQVESADHVFSYPPEEVTAAADAVLAALQRVSPLDDAQPAGNTDLDPTLVVLAAARLLQDGRVGMKARDDGSYVFWLVEQKGCGDKT
jgi:hypothetical protein